MRKQTRPQFTPSGDDVTVPVPLPFFSTLNIEVTSEGDVKRAVTVALAVSVIVHGATEHPPPANPEKKIPEPAVPESVTAVPAANSATQVWPQLMPAGDEVTVPRPPSLKMVSVTARAAGDHAIRANTPAVQKMRSNRDACNMERLRGR